jgi:hypothetical protein
MKLLARCFTLLFSVLAVASLGCESPEPTAAPLDVSLHKTPPGNPDCRLEGRDRARGPYDFLCAIEIPGNPLTSSQKGWVEQSNATYFLSDASNNGVDVFDVKTHTYVDRIGGMAGNATTGGGTATTNGAGPNAFVSAPVRKGHKYADDDDHGGKGPKGGERVLFVSDGNSRVHVVDMDHLQILATISTAKSDCDGGTPTTKFCGRSNEIDYDPVHHVVGVSNPNPLSYTRCTAVGANCTNNAGIAAAGATLEGYLTLISARAPYNVLGHLTFGAGTVEGHVWVPPLNRFLLPMQGAPGGPFIEIINVRTRTVETPHRAYDCVALTGAASTGNNNLRMAAGNNLWAQMCGRPMRLNARTGAVLNVVTQVGTGDEDWYNPGDDTFLVTGNDAATGVSSLGIMNASTGAWLQNVPSPGGGSPSAYAKTNEIFTRVTFGAMDATSRCVVKGRGCVVVFARTGTPGKHGH